MKQPLESKSLPESPSAYADGPQSRLSSDRVDQLLAEQFSKAESPEPRGAAPMEGIWLAAAVGIVLWTLIAGVVLLA
jgi:hypothetical protein